MSAKELSRNCIRDTYLAKRQAREQLTGWARAMYDVNMQILRAGQLAPHVETKMVPGRYLGMQALKSAAPEIVIIVKGGMVQEVKSTNPYTQVLLCDYDTDDEYEYGFGEERAAQPDMHTVY